MNELKDVFSKFSKNKKNLVLIMFSLLAVVLLIASEFTTTNNSNDEINVKTGVSSTEYIKSQIGALK